MRDKYAAFESDPKRAAELDRLAAGQARRLAAAGAQQEQLRDRLLADLEQHKLALTADGLMLRAELLAERAELLARRSTVDEPIADY
ncbi:MAG: hypothetical protein NT062_00675, partial [Proteobacteria bacterium]|nr:hypothetical protein [Pseudomonadota bacterium]